MKIKEVQGQDPLCSEEMQLKEMFPDVCRRELLEGLAMSHVLSVYKISIEMLASDNNLNSVANDIVDEWYYLCFEGPCVEDRLEHRTFLREALSLHKVRFPELGAESSWQDLILAELGEWDRLIDLALEHGWGFEELRERYRSTDHFESALENGADPSISTGALIELIDEGGWINWHRMHQSLGLRPRDSWETATSKRLELWQETQGIFGRLLDKRPEDVTIKDIRDFFKKQQD